MEDAGIDTLALKVQFVRGAACSTVSIAGITTKDILDAVDWSSEGTFQRFYSREFGEKDGTVFGRTVLSFKQSSNNTY